MISPVTAYGYIRVSQVRSDNKLSPEAQKTRLEAYCASKGYDLNGIFEDLDVPGSHFNRPGWKELVDTVKRGNIIVCNEYTRVGRNLRETLARIEELDQRGVNIVSLEQELDTTTAAGRLQYQVLLVLAEFERNRLSERMRQTHAVKRARGTWKGGTLPLGYVYGPDGIEIDEGGAEVVRGIYSMRRRGYSVRTIAAECGMWTSTVSNVLTNRAYIGERERDGEVHDVGLPPLMAPEEWEEVQNLRKRDGRRPSRKYLLSGLLVCGKCGRTLVHQRHPGGDYYFCSNGGTVVRRGVAEKAVTEAFFAKMEAWAGSYEKYKTEYRKQIGRKKPTGLESLRRKQDRLLDAYLAGKVPEEQYLRVMKETGRKIEELERRVAGDELRAPPQYDGDIKQDWSYLTLEEQREVLARVLVCVRVRPGRGASRLSCEWAL